MSARSRGVDLVHPTRRHPRGTPLERAVVDSALYCGGVRVPGVLSLADAAAKARSERDAFVWVGLHEPDDEAIAATAREFGLHPLAVEDAVTAHQRPKLDVYPEHLFVVLRTVRYVDSQEVVRTGEIMVFVGPDFVVTVRHGDGEGLAPVRRDLEARPELLRLGPGAVLWAVADRVVDGYGPAVDGVTDDVDEVGDQVFADDRQSPTRRIYLLKREVLEFSRAVRPLVDATGRLARSEPGRLHPDLAPLFQDVHDHVLRADERVHGLDELLSSTLDANVAQVSLQQNNDMRKISAYAAILTVCTTVAGVYGMNFDTMPELHWRFGYPYALLLMGGVSVAMYRAFRRNRWL